MSSENVDSDSVMADVLQNSYHVLRSHKVIPAAVNCAVVDICQLYSKHSLV